MILKSFRVRKFRNVVDSGEITVDEMVTCLVGKNEAGKSGILEALYYFNPSYDETFNVDEHYPRWLTVSDRRKGELNEQIPISVTLTLEGEDIEEVENLVGPDVLSGHEFTVSKNYAGKRTWSISCNDKQLVKNICANNSLKQKELVNAEDTEALFALLSEAKEKEGHNDSNIDSALEEIETKGLKSASAWSVVNPILIKRLPSFFRFTSYSTLPGRIDFRELSSTREEGPGESGLQTARALLALAGTETEQLANENYELRKGELEAVQIDLTNQVFEYWKQNPQLEVLIDVDKETQRGPNGTTAVSRFLDIRLRDKRTGYSNNFAQRSSGFQWFFSFLAAFSEFENERNPIVLLDEPALTLHGKAQADFLRFINERLASESQVLYTTHSPFMVEADRLERARIVEDKGPPLGAVVSSDILSSDPDSLFPLQAALGYDIAQSLFVGPNNLVVEGTSDFIYLSVMSSLCKAASRSFLDAKWRILPAGGATNIPTFVSLIGPHLDITVLADSDTKGMQRVTNMSQNGLLNPSRLILASAAIESNHADLEDLFSEGDYLKLYNDTFGSSIKLSDLPDGNRIVKRVEAKIGASFDHGEVAETLLRSHLKMSFTDTTMDRFAKLFTIINNTMGS